MLNSQVSPSAPITARPLVFQSQESNELDQRPDGEVKEGSGVLTPGRRLGSTRNTLPKEVRQSTQATATPGQRALISIQQRKTVFTREESRKEDRTETAGSKHPKRPAAAEVAHTSSTAHRSQRPTIRQQRQQSASQDQTRHLRRGQRDQRNLARMPSGHQANQQNGTK